MEDIDDYSELYEINPEAFTWLDYAEEFFKHDGSFGIEGSRTIPLRDGKSYDIGQEFDQLERMHKASPDKVVEPLMSLEKDGETVGFYMERVEGEHVTNYFREGKGDMEEHEEIIIQVEEFIDTMERENLVHGDLMNNILYDGDTIKVIDPVGTPETEQDFETLREYDEEFVEIIEESSPYLSFCK